MPLAFPVLTNAIKAIHDFVETIASVLPVARGAGGGLKVDGSGTALPVSGTVTSNDGGTPITGTAIPAGGAGVIGWLSAAWKLLNGGLPAALGVGGGLKIDGSGTALPVSGAVTVSGTATVTQGAAGANAWPTSLAAQPALSMGTPYRNIDLDENGVLIGAAGARKLMGWYMFNNAAAVRYVKLYDHADAPVVGDAADLRLTIALPAGAAANVSLGSGIPFTAGLGARATTGVADADVGAPGANEVVVNLFYQ